MDDSKRLARARAYVSGVFGPEALQYVDENVDKNSPASELDDSLRSVLEDWHGAQLDKGVDERTIYLSIVATIATIFAQGIVMSSKKGDEVKNWHLAMHLGIISVEIFARTMERGEAER